MPRRKLISDEAVLDAAAGVILSAGPADFTLADVAKASGIAPATLIQRFGDKRGLAIAALARENQRFSRTLAELPDGGGAAVVIAILRFLTPDIDAAESDQDPLLWLRQDLSDPALGRLARARIELLRAAIAKRLPPLAMAPADAARLVEAQWHGAIVQWAIAREGRLVDFVTASLAAWFSLARAP